MAFDIGRAFARIEDILIESMIRNLKRHRAEETKEGFNWEQWQALQLRELEKYKRENAKRFQEDFEDINRKLEDALNESYNTEDTRQERSVLQWIKDKFTRRKKPKDDGVESPKFFGVNDKRLDALIGSVEKDLEKAEHAVLRRSNDIYRQVIMDAQAYLATGTATYEQAVDMATKDFLSRGIDSIVYKNGSRHTIEEYSRMALKTAQKRAYLLGQGKLLDEYGIHTVRVNNRTDACPLCVGWLGRVLVDDVYAHGTKEEAQKAGVPLLSKAMDEGFLHPNCKDVYSMYIEGVSRPAKPLTEEEIREAVAVYNKEQKERRAEYQKKKYQRLAKFSLDPANQQKYQARADEWKEARNVIVSSKPKRRSQEEPKETGGMNIYTNDEVEAMSQTAFDLVQRYLDSRSRYSGKTNILPLVPGPIAKKDWNCDISTMPWTSMHTLLHEHIHAHSISIFAENLETEDEKKAYYEKYAKEEESAVELMAREISEREGFSFAVAGSYDKQVNALYEKQKQCPQFSSALDFAKALLKVRPENRKEWIENQISKKD